MRRPGTARPLLGALLALAATLALWWFWLGHYLAASLLFPVGLVLQGLAPDEMLGLGFRRETGFVLLTTLAPLNQPAVLAEVPIQLTRFTFIFPLFWGLVLATPVAVGKRLRQLFVGTTLVLFPCAVLMTAMYALFKLGLTINHQAYLTELPPPYYVLHLPYPDWLYHLLGVGRQLALLVMPTMVPLLAWGGFNHELLRAALPTRAAEAEK